YDQRCFLQDLGLTVPRFVAIQQVPVPEQERYTDEELAAMEAQEKDFIPPPPPESLPDADPRLVIKARRLGYDGQGIFIVEEKEEFWNALDQLGQTPAILEQFIPFERELAVIAARSLEGEIVVYPVVETQQENQVCRRVLAPAEISSDVKEEVEAIARKILDKLQAVGVFGIELFLTPENQVIVNEISPRTHNSGHYTIDACKTSQFEQHLRAVCGLPLGEVDLLKPAVMVNLLGYEHSQTEFYSLKRQLIAAIPNARVHWYGKTESRPGRKLGHVTILLDEPSANQREQLLELARQVETIWYGDQN
ncbi:MAG TPA: 5-(carboxyamino)imidazole ribonucleotide synthase, partial [Cyanobacteria bacterium UBA11368]|nr:5-(carboxyamino)imidazole ribonucleotide synthase [Cyanobacteria bacterium UBA11368]